MRKGGIPDWVKSGKMHITGRVGYGPDVRDRGTGTNVPLEVDLSKGQGRRYIEPGPGTHWDAIEEQWEDLDDEDLEDLIGEELISEDIGDSYGWDFPGGSYTVAIF
jgi:hypothetical protein